MNIQVAGLRGRINRPGDATHGNPITVRRKRPDHYWVDDPATSAPYWIPKTDVRFAPGRLPSTLTDIPLPQPDQVDVAIFSRNARLCSRYVCCRFRNAACFSAFFVVAMLLAFLKLVT